MHHIGQILHHNDRRELQNRGAEHPHAGIHVKDAPRIDENQDSEVEEFIDRYITCSLHFGILPANSTMKTTVP